MSKPRKKIQTHILHGVVQTITIFLKLSKLPWFLKNIFVILFFQKKVLNWLNLANAVWLLHRRFPPKPVGLNSMTNPHLNNYLSFLKSTAEIKFNYAVHIWILTLQEKNRTAQQTEDQRINKKMKLKIKRIKNNSHPITFWSLRPSITFFRFLSVSLPFSFFSFISVVLARLCDRDRSTELGWVQHDRAPDSDVELGLYQSTQDVGPWPNCKAEVQRDGRDAARLARQARHSRPAAVEGPPCRPSPPHPHSLGSSLIGRSFSSEFQEQRFGSKIKKSRNI